MTNIRFSRFRQRTPTRQVLAAQLFNGIANQPVRDVGFVKRNALVAVAVYSNSEWIAKA
jgi:hypothetical protein